MRAARRPRDAGCARESACGCTKFPTRGSLRTRSWQMGCRLQLCEQRSEVRLCQSLIERREITLQDLPQLHIDAGHFLLERLEGVQLCRGGCEVGASCDIAAAGAHLGVEPDEIEIDTIGFDEIFVIAVAQRPGD